MTTRLSTTHRAAIVASSIVAITAFGAVSAYATGSVTDAPICSIAIAKAPIDGGPWTPSASTDGTIIDAYQAGQVTEALGVYNIASVRVANAADDYLTVLEDADAASENLNTFANSVGYPAANQELKLAQAAWRASRDFAILLAVLSAGAPTYAVTPGAGFVVDTAGLAAESWSMTQLVATMPGSGGSAGGAFGSAKVDPAVNAPDEPGLYRLVVLDGGGIEIVNVLVSVDATPWTTAFEWAANSSAEYQAYNDAQAAFETANNAFRADPDGLAGNVNDTYAGWNTFVGSNGAVSPHATDQDYWLETANPDLYAAFDKARADYLDAVGLDAAQILANADAIFDAQPRDLTPLVVAPKTPTEWMAAYNDALSLAISAASLEVGDVTGNTVAFELCAGDTADVSFVNTAGAVASSHMTADGATFTNDSRGSIEGMMSGNFLFSGYSSGLVELPTQGYTIVRFRFDAPYVMPPVTTPDVRFVTDLT